MRRYGWLLLLLGALLTGCAHSRMIVSATTMVEDVEVQATWEVK